MSSGYGAKCFSTPPFGFEELQGAYPSFIRTSIRLTSWTDLRQWSSAKSPECIMVHIVNREHRIEGSPGRKSAKLALSLSLTPPFNSFLFRLKGHGPRPPWLYAQTCIFNGSNRRNFIEWENFKKTPKIAFFWGFWPLNGILGYFYRCASQKPCNCWPKYVSWTYPSLKTAQIAKISKKCPK